MTTLSSSKIPINEVVLPFEVVDSKGAKTLVLRGRLGVQQARPLWDCLRSALHAGGCVQLDAGSLESMDTSIVQILCRASREKTPLQIAKISDGFIEALKLRGLGHYFALDSPIHEEPVPSAPVLRKVD